MVFFRAVFRKRNVEALERHLLCRGGLCNFLITWLKAFRDLGFFLILEVERVRQSSHYALEPAFRRGCCTLGEGGFHFPARRIIRDCGQSDAAFALVGVSASAFWDVSTGEVDSLGDFSSEYVLGVDEKLVVSFQQTRADELACFNLFTVEFIGWFAAYQCIIGVFDVKLYSIFHVLCAGWSCRNQLQRLVAVDARICVEGINISLGNWFGEQTGAAEGGIGKQLRVVLAIGISTNGERICIARRNVVLP